MKNTNITPETLQVHQVRKLAQEAHDDGDHDTAAACMAWLRATPSVNREALGQELCHVLNNAAAQE